MARDINNFGADNHHLTHYYLLFCEWVVLKQRINRGFPPGNQNTVTAWRGGLLSLEETRNKSNDYFESLQYRQDVRHIAHYHKRKHFPIAIHVAQKITVICAQKIGKSAVWNLILCSSAVWRRREKFEHGCITTYHPRRNNEVGYNVDHRKFGHFASEEINRKCNIVGYRKSDF